MRTAPSIVLSEEEQQMLGLWARLPAAARLAVRANIVLLAAEGHANRAIAQQLGVTVKSVSLWRRRFQTQRLAGIEKAAPRGKPQPEVPDALVEQIIQTTLGEPPESTRRWSLRSLARELGVSPSLVRRVWKVMGIAPPGR